jgi:hypothetical protein
VGFEKCVLLFEAAKRDISFTNSLVRTQNNGRNYFANSRGVRFLGAGEAQSALSQTRGAVNYSPFCWLKINAGQLN